MSSDLFSASGDAIHAARAPLAEKLRPVSLDDVVGQDHLAGPGRPLRVMVERRALRSVILWGPAGSGKTTLARLVAAECGHSFEMLSAVSATVKDIRSLADAARQRLVSGGVATALFLDEIHRFTRSQQDALLPHVESGLITLVGATTESPWATVNRPLLSRCTVLQLHALDGTAMQHLVDRGLAELGVGISDAARAMVLRAVDGDGRRLLTALEVATDVTVGPEIDVAAVTAAIGAGAGHYDRGDHYDAASAFIKHMRAGDEIQAVAWLIHMLDGGEDPRFIARRMVVFASEDVGAADRSALIIAIAAAHAVDLVGLPEARYNLAHAAVVMARAPKSRHVVELMAAAPEVELVAPSQ